MFERLGLLSMGMAAAALLCACQPEAEETKPEAAAPAAPAAPEAAASAAAETPPASPGQATLPAECKIMNAEIDRRLAEAERRPQSMTRHHCAGSRAVIDSPDG